MDDKQRERYIRWQGYRISQLSFSINLFLTFAIASLAYVINLKLNKSFALLDALNTIIFWWSACASLGVIATISRLLDFRHTAKKIKDGGASNTLMARWSGRVTWGAFWAQIITYCIGAYYFIVSVALT